MEHWRLVQRSNFTHLEKLLTFLEFPESERHRFASRIRFPLNLPRRLAEKIEKGNFNDPILRQFIPLSQELDENPLYVLDPVCDQSFQKTAKLLHKYQGRALLIVTSACAMHCRYCFRQNYPYETELKGYEKELELIREDTSIKEVLLSGGDPLSLSDQTLKELLDSLNQIPHIQRIRFHTRFPIGIPERITTELLAILKSCSKALWFVLHINHAREIDADVETAIKRLQEARISVLNQSVLLRGVNSSFEAHYELLERLINIQVIPYYLHLLDPVAGSAHFEVPITEAKELISFLKTKLPGYAIPKLAQEIPGEPSKTWI